MRKVGVSRFHSFVQHGSRQEIPKRVENVVQSGGSGNPEGEPEADWESQKGWKTLRKVGVREVRGENRRLSKRVENVAQTGGTAIAGRQPKPLRKF